jgi:hypothetical protein
MIGSWYFFVPVEVLLKDGTVIIEEFLEPVDAVDAFDGAALKLELFHFHLPQVLRQLLDVVEADVELAQANTRG